GGAVRGRYSIIGLEPDLIWRTVEGRAEINRTPRRNGTFTPCNEPPLKALRALVAESQIALPDTLPPMAAGVFGYLGYDMLRRTNPSPYLYFLDLGDFAIAGSSPEILVKASGGTVTIRPIAGTRPRGATPHEDMALEAELLADPKERAEHLMLLDLGRNDVGRVAQIGTVKVTDQFFIERYSQVMHIVSNVEGALADEHDAIDALAAGFPAGTVSGAPK